MQEAELSKYMKLGFVHFMAYPETMSGGGKPADSIMALAADSFFDVIEITHIEDPAQRAEAKSMIDMLGRSACYGAQPTLLLNKLDLNSADEDERQKAITAMRDAADEAVEMASPSLVVVSGPNCDDKHDAIARLVDSLCELCQYASPKGLSIVLETFDQVDYGKNLLIGPTRDAVKVSEMVRVKHDNFGILLDLSHLPLLGESPTEAVKLAGEHLVHAHAGNCVMDDPTSPLYGDEHPRFDAPGSCIGVDELAEYIKALMDIGFLAEGKNNLLSFEVKPMADETAESVAANCKRTLLQAWRKL